MSVVLYTVSFTSSYSQIQHYCYGAAHCLDSSANGMMGGFGAILAENYPAEARSTAENFIFGTGRGLAGFGPVIIGLLAAGGNLMGALSLIFIIYPIGLITMLLCVPETKDKVLE